MTKRKHDRVYCSECKWFDKSEHNPSVGKCRLSPPIPGCMWTTVCDDDWCREGEYKEDEDG